MSTRYSAPLVALLLVALVPTVVHSYLGLRQDDGRRAMMATRALRPPGSATKRGVEWAREILGTDDWVEFNYLVQGEAVRLSVARSYDAKALYHHPELGITHGLDLPEHAVVRIADPPGLVLHVLRNPGRSPQMVVYALHSGTTFIDEPLVWQLQTMPEGLVRGHPAVTLFFATGPDHGNAPLERAAAVTLLVESVNAFLASPAREDPVPVR